jgi:hypothetical protein
MLRSCYSHIVRRKFQLSRTPNNTEASRNSAQESKGTASQLDDPQIKDARFAVLLTGQIFESSRRRGRRAARSRRTRTRGTRPPLRSSSTRRRHLPPSTGPDSGPRRKHERFRGGGGSMKRRGWRSMWWWEEEPAGAAESDAWRRRRDGVGATRPRIGATWSLRATGSAAAGCLFPPERGHHGWPLAAARGSKRRLEKARSAARRRAEDKVEPPMAVHQIARFSSTELDGSERGPSQSSALIMGRSAVHSSIARGASSAFYSHSHTTSLSRLKIYTNRPFSLHITARRTAACASALLLLTV